MPAGETYTFETRWEYDSWNRLKTISYPDGEKLRYIYNNGGQLASMSGEKSGTSYNYINYLGYDKHEKRLRINYGNGTFAKYQYNPLNLQLTNLTSYNSLYEEMQNINYTYDDVNNITNIQNQANYTSNLMGGQYEYNYQYDAISRLISSNSSWNNYSSELQMSYTPSGNILNKSQNATTFINGDDVYINYSRDYNYDPGNQPHTVFSISGTGGETNFNWDANGNLIFFERSGENSLIRTHCWDEENRLSSVGDNNYVSQYIYDAGGERVWKHSGEVQQMNINMENTINYFDMNNTTLYTNPYMVVNDHEYTKHFYIESQRICSKIGGGMMYNPIDIHDQSIGTIYSDFNQLSITFLEKMQRDIECIGPFGSVEVNQIPFVEFVNGLPNSDNEERDLYFYHSDHLGSSSFITDADGITTQHLQYLPYGELFVEQRSTANYFTPYKFSAKEKDEETSYSYFGARYLASDFSFWLSVDPLADKYPNISPFAYCAWNPVIYFDPDGKEKVIWVENNNKSKDATIYKAASNAKDNNEAIHIYAHGSPNGITANINGKEINIRNAKQFDEVMKETSSKWKNRKEGENLIVILHSCRTGRETKNGDDSFAEELSKDNSFKNVTFVAPDERDYFSPINGEIGPYKAKYADKNGDYNKFNNDGTPNKEMSNNKGNWRVFRNGKEILKVYGSTVLLNPNNNIKNEKE